MSARGGICFVQEYVSIDINTYDNTVFVASVVPYGHTTLTMPDLIGSQKANQGWAWSVLGWETAWCCKLLHFSTHTAEAAAASSLTLKTEQLVGDTV